MLDLFTVAASVGLQADVEKIREDRPESHVETNEENYQQDDIADMADSLNAGVQAIENACSALVGFVSAPVVDLRLPTTAAEKK